MIQQDLKLKEKEDKKQLLKQEIHKQIAQEMQREELNSREWRKSIAQTDASSENSRIKNSSRVQREYVEH